MPLSERIDASAARGVPGVLGVFTAADLVDLGPLPCTVPVASVAPMIVPPRFALASERARHVGDPVAFVVAETRAAARDAAELVAVDWQALPSVVDAPAALLSGAPLLWEQAPDNLSYRFQKGDQDAVRDAIFGAAHVVELELVNNRIVISSLETRGAIGRHDDDGFHLMFSGAGVHALQSQLADSVFRVARRADACCLSGCRWRLRREERAVPRMGDAAVGGAHTRPPGAVDERARARISSPPLRAATT